jgi:1-acyl-sn-glycerol-3-phosphate acyltransferase
MSLYDKRMSVDISPSIQPAQGFPEMPPLAPQVRSWWRRGFGILMLCLTGWRVAGTMPNLPKFVLIVAPHTSNWDFFYGALAYFTLRLETVWLVKDSAIKGPWGVLARHFGAAPIDRSHAHNVVQAYIAEFAKRDKMILTITPEGTRKKVPDWKHGFYYVAIGAKVPVVPVALDFQSRRIIIHPPFTPTGKIDTDVPYLKSLYHKEMARRPENFWD